MINRQVDDIHHLVDEFSSFARMPSPKLKIINMMIIIDYYNGVTFILLRFPYEVRTTNPERCLVGLYKRLGGEGRSKLYRK